MRVALAADHAGYALKELLRAHLASRVTTKGGAAAEGLRSCAPGDACRYSENDRFAPMMTLSKSLKLTSRTSPMA